MNHKTYVITGGNTGIGKAIALALAQKQVPVVITSRDPQKGAAAAAEIRQASGHEAVDVVVGDLGSVASTHRLAEALLDHSSAIGVLINNAGVWMTKRTINEDNLEYSFMVNHLAPFILTHRLLPCLQRNAPTRIVNVSAGLYVRGKVDLAQTPFGQDFSRMGTYANTKLCNLLFTRELAKRLQDSPVTVNAVHPGVIRTNLGDTTGIMGVILRLLKRSWDTPEEGAKAPVWCATSPGLEEVSGQYFDLQVPVDVDEAARDEALGRELWDLSLSLARFDAYE